MSEALEAALAAFLAIDPYAYDDVAGESFCISCQAEQPEPHAPGCAWAAAIALTTKDRP